MDMTTFKRMCRLLEFQRRGYFEKAWPLLCRNSLAADLSPRQINHLMMIRFRMPCNLAEVMHLTGLSSSAASVFVDRLVKSGVVRRDIDASDRRNILIGPTPETQRLFNAIDERLNNFIIEQLEFCTDAERELIEAASAILCRRLDEIPDCAAEIQIKSGEKL
ncbi:MAG: MarR family transcriptional regulator [Victivallaceae bacterium]|nr:MarR family transcriptional regulator [Victivallaceae bacterium]